MATNPLEKYLQNDLADFAGLHVSGTIPVKQEILNDLLQTALADMVGASSAPSSPAAASDTPTLAAPGLDPKRLLKFLKKAEIRAEEGRLMLDFDVSVTGQDK